MKKLLALVLALVMTMSLVTISNAAYTDEKDVNYDEAIDVMTAIGVLNGYTDGSIKPQGLLTRAESAKMITVVMGLEDVKGTAPFTDLSGAQWAESFIATCAKLGIVNGIGNNMFAPAAQLTGYAWAKMLAGALGFDAQIEGMTGANWQIATAKIIDVKDLADGIDKFNGNANITREEAAQMAFNALNAAEVEYTYTVSKIATDKLDKDGEPVYLYSEFGLTKYEGVVTSVDYADGVTKLGEFNDKRTEFKADVYSLANTPADMADIGYQVHAWAKDSKKEAATHDSITGKVYRDGVSLGTSTNGTPLDDLTDKDADEFIAKYDATDADNGMILCFYNGVPVNPNDFFDGTAYKSDIDWNNDNGLFIDLIDNDVKGEIEAIVVLDYDVATVDAVVTKDSTTGANGTKTETYIFNNDDIGEVKTKYVLTEDELDVDDVVTFIAYGDYFYVRETTNKTGAYTKYSSETYTIGGDKYTLVHKDNNWADDYNYCADDLPTTPDAENYKLWLDPFGYVLGSEQVSDPDQYLFVITNEDKEANEKYVEAVVAFADGSVKKIQINKIDGDSVNDYHWAQLEDNELSYTGDGFMGDAYSYGIYTYTEKDGKYAITPVDDTYYTDYDYETGDVEWKDDDGNTTVTSKTILVDLIKYMDDDATKGTAYTGRKNIPSVADPDLFFVYDEDNMVISFLINGNDVTKFEADSFVVYDTDYEIETTKETSTKSATTTHTVDVIKDGKKVADYDLGTDKVNTSEREDYKFESTDAFGVGFYTFDKHGHLDNYISFAERMSTFNWNNTEELATYQGVKWDCTSDTPFYVLDIAKGTATKLTLKNSGKYLNNDMGNVFVEFASDHCDFDAKKNSIVAVYYIDGELSDTYESVSFFKDNVEYTYYPEDGYVTDYEIDEYYTIDVVNNVANTTVSVSGAEHNYVPYYATSGAEVTVTLIADTGYALSDNVDMTVNGAQQVVNDNTITFTVKANSKVVITGTAAPAVVNQVVYKNNTGSGTMTDTDVTYGAAAVTLSANTFTKEGYTFTGWNTKADGTGTAYAANATVSNLLSDLNLYAQWSENTYNVTVLRKDNDVTTGDVFYSGMTLAQINSFDQVATLGWAATGTTEGLLVKTVSAIGANNTAVTVTYTVNQPNP